jgi:G3E family GTPase
MEDRLLDTFSPDFGQPSSMAFLNQPDMVAQFKHALVELEKKRLSRLQVRRVHLIGLHHHRHHHHADHHHRHHHHHHHHHYHYDHLKTAAVRSITRPVARQAHVNRGVLKPRIERICEKYEFTKVEVSGTAPAATSITTSDHAR